ncbi:MAG: hypothetical protein JXA66_08305 [Oligoflexia bacterium]|nr:hypothetical protein [Oligoflexia bacterium]
MKIVRVVTATAVLIVLVYYGSRYVIGRYEKKADGTVSEQNTQMSVQPEEMVNLMAAEKEAVETAPVASSEEAVPVTTVKKNRVYRKTPPKEEVIAENRKAQAGDEAQQVDNAMYSDGSTVTTEFVTETEEAESNWQHRISAGVQTSFDREKALTFVTRDNAHRTLPTINYGLTYRTGTDIKSPYWMYGLDLKVGNKFDVDYVEFPLTVAAQLRASRHLAISGSSTYFNPTLAYKFDTDSIMGVDGGSFTDRNIYTNWIGFVSEFVTSIGRHFVEYLPYVYKSFYSESNDRRLGGWEAGMKANLILSYNINFLATAEYSYKSLITSNSDLRYISHNIMVGVGTTF